MYFKLTEEQELIRDNMREFARTYVDPVAVEIDENSRYPEEVIKKLAEGGWMGMPFPTEYGGAGLTILPMLSQLKNFPAPVRLPVLPCLYIPDWPAAHIQLWHRRAEEKIPDPHGQRRTPGSLCFD